MVLYISTGYLMLGIVYLDQLKGAHHTHISYHDNGILKKTNPLPLLLLTPFLNVPL